MSARHCLTAVFLLVLFLGSKSIEFHALSHSQDEDPVSCEWCDDALLIQSTPFHPVPAFVADFGVSISAEDPIQPLCLPASDEHPDWEPFFGRPPPVA